MGSIHRHDLFRFVSCRVLLFSTSHGIFPCQHQWHGVHSIPYNFVPTFKIFFIFLILLLHLLVPLLPSKSLISTQAALTAFPPSSSPVTLHPVTQIEDVFSAVQLNTAHRGVIPFENSSNGSVVFTLDLFADVAGKYPDVLVCGEAYVAVRHCLLGFSPRPTSLTEKDGNNLQSNGGEGEQASKSKTEDKDEPTQFSHIKTVYSHPQAWGQCKSFLSTHLRHADKQDVSSTSRAAELASQDPSGASAALSSIMAASLFGLDILAEGVNDKLGNTTRFLVIRNKTIPSSDEPTPQEFNIRADALADAQLANTLDTPRWKSLVTFTVEHSNPGALANCLTAFAEQGINLTAINTRPSGVRNWHYVFFVEFMGRRRGGNDDDLGKVNSALKGLDKACRRWRWLGSWENRLEDEKKEGEASA